MPLLPPLILSYLARALPWLPIARPPPRRPRPAPDVGDSPPEDRPLGCGWFDSSHELQTGLQIHEDDAQALAALPLGDWLALELREWTGNEIDPADRGIIAA